MRLLVQNPLRLVPLTIGVVILIVGINLIDSKDTRTIGGVLIGAGIAVGVEGFRYLTDMFERDRETRLRDLDETRRVLYMAYAALFGEQGTRAEIAGTAANALAHHAEKRDRLQIHEAAQLAVDLQISPGGSQQLQDRIVAEIHRITKELGDKAPPLMW